MSIHQNKISSTLAADDDASGSRKYRNNLKLRQNRFTIVIFLFFLLLQRPIVVASLAASKNKDCDDSNDSDCSFKVDAGEQPSNLSDFASTVHNTAGESWSSLVTSYIDVVRSGLPYRDKAGDVYVDTIEEGLIQLEDMVELSKQREEEGGKGGGKKTLAWELVATDEICKELKKTRHDLYKSFLVWSTTDSMNDVQCENGIGGKNGHSIKINVSKAHRRLE
eukprot:4845336-Ditylum_brightwellii.AAC.1